MKESPVKMIKLQFLNIQENNGNSQKMPLKDKN
jgi:hypothetical protein